LRERIAQLTAHPNARAIAVGGAAAALTPLVLPYAKPVLRATIKSGVLWFEKAKGAIAEAGETLADIAAEARAEAQASVYPPAVAKTGAIAHPDEPNA